MDRDIAALSKRDGTCRLRLYAVDPTVEARVFSDAVGILADVCPDVDYMVDTQT